MVTIIMIPILSILIMMILSTMIIMMLTMMMTTAMMIIIIIIFIIFIFNNNYAEAESTNIIKNIIIKGNNSRAGKGPLPGAHRAAPAAPPAGPGSAMELE